MGSGLEEYWDGVDGPAKRQVAVECSLVFWFSFPDVEMTALLILSLRLPALESQDNWPP